MRLLNRRELLQAAAALAATPVGAAARAADGTRPSVIDGAIVGDVTSTSAVLWSRTDRPARLRVEWVGERSGEPVRVAGPLATSRRDFTAQVVLDGLPPGATITAALRFEDDATGASSDPVLTTFRTAPITGGRARDVRFVWSADLGGQGWGIDPERGGYRIFQTIAARDPDLFLMAGDRIYADDTLAPERALPDGTTWKNLTIPATSAVAETLQDLRDRYRYHQADDAWRDFGARTGMIATWDDHEVVDNWAPDTWLHDDRYALHDVNTLISRARQAWGEYTPMRPFDLDWARIYRHIPYGPLLDVFVLDTRSYRFENGDNHQAYPRPEAAWMGRAQLGWLKRAMRRSTGRWKVVLMPQPISMLIWNDWKKKEGYDGVANGPGAPLGREHEVEELLRFLHDERLNNVVFLSADVHFTAAVHFHPDRANFQGFTPFWEFVTGPLHAGCYGPCELDPTFGPELRFQRTAPEGQAGIGPASPYQFFGEVTISEATGALTVRLIDIDGGLLHTETLLSA